MSTYGQNKGPGTLFLPETKPSSTSTFGIQYQDAVKDLKLHPENVAKFQFPETPPWCSKWCFEQVGNDTENIQCLQAFLLYIFNV